MAISADFLAAPILSRADTATTTPRKARPVPEWAAWAVALAGAAVLHVAVAAAVILWGAGEPEPPKVPEVAIEVNLATQGTSGGLGGVSGGGGFAGIPIEEGGVVAAPDTVATLAPTETALAVPPKTETPAQPVVEQAEPVPPDEVSIPEPPIPEVASVPVELPIPQPVAPEGLEKAAPVEPLQAVESVEAVEAVSPAAGPEPAPKSAPSIEPDRLVRALDGVANGEGGTGDGPSESTGESSGVGEAGGGVAGRGEAEPGWVLGTADNPAPKYPYSARLRGWEGTVVLEVTVRADGGVAAVRIHESSGRSALDEAARRAVERWTFEPATINGLPKPGTAMVPIRFQLTG